MYIECLIEKNQNAKKKEHEPTVPSDFDEKQLVVAQVL